MTDFSGIGSFADTAIDLSVSLWYLSIAALSSLTQSSKEVSMIIEATGLMTKLADARAECRVSQYKLARKARVGKQTIVNAEHGIVISRISAHAILRALNELRVNDGLDPIGFYELDWKIQGE